VIGQSGSVSNLEQKVFRKGLMAALKISFECSILYRLLLFSGRTLPNRAAVARRPSFQFNLTNGTHQGVRCARSETSWAKRD
jgi:hypothetical protein